MSRPQLEAMIASLSKDLLHLQAWGSEADAIPRTIIATLIKGYKAALEVTPA